MCTTCLLFSPAISYAFGICLSQPLIYWKTADLVLHWHWNYLPERTSCSFKNNKHSQGARYCWYMVCWNSMSSLIFMLRSGSCTLSYKNCHLTLLCRQHHFGTILTIFAKLEYYFECNKLAITLQPSRKEELCHFTILIEKYRVLQLLCCEESQSRWRSFSCFFRTKIWIVIFLSDGKKCISNLWHITK